MKFIYALGAIALAVVISTVADVFLKKSDLSNANYLVLGILLYAIAAPAVAIGFNLVDFSVVFFIWEAVAIVLGLALGIIMFGEQLSLLKFLAFASSFLAVIFSYYASK